MKKRLIFKNLVDFIEGESDYRIALLTGLRLTGKTTLLRQLKEKYGDEAAYLNLTEEKDGVEAIWDTAFGADKLRVLLLDEISYLSQYEMVAESLYELDDKHPLRNTKIIMTGSSPSHLARLNTSKLGARSKLFRLPLLTFVEYMYFTDRITSYTEYDNVTSQDFADYLQLKGLTGAASELAIQFDEEYFKAFYGEIEVSNTMSYLTHSCVDLKENDLIDLVNILAYKLSEASSYEKTVNPRVGGQEHHHLYNQGIRVKASKIDLSSTIIEDSVKAVPDILVKDISRIIHFLLQAGLVSVEHTREEPQKKPRGVAEILGDLKSCHTKADMHALFKEVSICFVSPLYYTRIGEEIPQRMNVPVEKLYTGVLLGKMLELYVRGALVLYGHSSILVSDKLSYQDYGEVDVFDVRNRILCEISSRDKGDDETSVHRYFREHPFIRICSSREKDFFSEKFQYYQIPYARLCCMIDTGDIMNLIRTPAEPVDDEFAPSGFFTTLNGMGDN